MHGVTCKAACLPIGSLQLPEYPFRCMLKSRASAPDPATAGGASDVSPGAGRRSPSLREGLKQRTRSAIEKAAIELLARQGYRDTSVDQIVRRAGTTRTTFYAHFKSKADLIHVVQARRIAPALSKLCRELDAQSPMTRESLRAWVDSYAHTWRRIRVFFEAYGEASRTDPEVAATLLPDSRAVTGNMERLLSRFEGTRREALHEQLVLMFSTLDSLMFQVSVQPEGAAGLPQIEAFVDLYWNGLFKPALARNS